MKNIILFLLLFLSTVEAYSQTKNSTLFEDVDETELDTVIDSIWTEVVSWDNDTTLEKFNRREAYATQLENCATNRTSNEVTKKAMLFSFFIRLRNKDYQQIIQKFELTELAESSWMMIYPIYSKSLKNEVTFEEKVLKLDSLAFKMACSKCQIKIYTELGELHYFQDDLLLAKNYFEKALDLNKNQEYNDLKDIIKSQSYFEGITKLSVGQPAKFFKTKDIFGKDIVIDTIGKVVLIDFWATWCMPCRKELPTLKNIYKKYKNNPNFKLISVSLDTDIEKLKSFIQKEGLEWTQVCDTQKRDGELVKLYNGFALPTYYLIDKNGIIRYNYFSKKANLDLEKILKELMESEN